MTDTIKDFFLIVTTIIGTVAAILAIWSKLRSSIEKNKEKKLVECSKNYFEVINSKCFISFRNKILENYYANFLTEINSRYFPVYTFKGVDYHWTLPQPVYIVKQLSLNNIH